MHMKIAKILLLMIVKKQQLMRPVEIIHRQQWDTIIIGVKVTCQRIRNVPFVEKLVGQANVSLEWDVNGVE